MGKQVNTAIKTAILFGTLEEVKRLVEAEKANLKEKKPPHNSPISHSIEYAIAAIKRGNVPMLNFLAGEGLALTDVEKIYGGNYNDSKTSALGLGLDIATHGLEMAALTLLGRPSNKKYNNAGITNALHLAVQYGQAEILTELLRIDHLNCFSQDPFGKTPLDYAEEYRGNEQLRAYMCAVLKDMQEAQKSGSKSKKDDATRKYIDPKWLPMKSDVITSNEFIKGGFGDVGDAPEIWGDVCAEVNKKYNALQKEIKNIRDRESSFLDKAFNGELKEIDIINFLEYGGSIDVTTDYTSTPGNQTALHRAAQNGHREVVDLLLRHGANVDIVDSDGHTAYQLASIKSHEVMQDVHKKAYKEIARNIEKAARAPSEEIHPVEVTRLKGKSVGNEKD